MAENSKCGLVSLGATSVLILPLSKTASESKQLHCTILTGQESDTIQEREHKRLTEKRNKELKRHHSKTKNQSTVMTQNYNETHQMGRLRDPRHELVTEPVTPPHKSLDLN